MNRGRILKLNWRIIAVLFIMISMNEKAVFCADEKVTVESNGLVQKSADGFDVDRKAAIIAALREAVEKACGVAIQSATKVEDFVVVKDVINTELSNGNNDLMMSDYRIIFEPRGYTRIDNSDMLEVKLEVNFIKKGESSAPVVPSEKQKSQQEEASPPTPAKRPATPTQLYCCDIYGIPRCTIAINPGPVGSPCFCYGQGTGITCAP